MGGRNPLVLATGLGSAAALAGIIQVPGLSQFFGCTPLDPLAWLTVVGCATGATALAAIAPHLLPAANSPDSTTVRAAAQPLTLTAAGTPQALTPADHQEHR